MMSKYEYEKRMTEIDSILNLLKCKEFTSVEELVKFLETERNWVLKNYKTFENDEAYKNCKTPDYNKVLEIIKNEGKISKTDLLRKSRLKAIELDRVCELLKENDEITESISDRTCYFYFWKCCSVNVTEPHST